MDSDRLKFYMGQYPFREIVAKDGKSIGHVMTCPVRLAFINLDKPKVGKPRKDGSIPEGKFSALLIVPPAADLSPLMSLVSSTGAAKFGAAEMQRKDEYGKPVINLAIKKQARLADKYQGFAKEGVYIDASSHFAVPVVDRNGAPMALPSDAVYSGMWALVRLRLYTYDNDGNRGVGLGLVAVQKLADDEQFSGNDATGEFGAIAEHPGSTSAPATTPDAKALMDMLS